MIRLYFFRRQSDPLQKRRRHRRGKRVPAEKQGRGLRQVRQRRLLSGYQALMRFLL